MVAIVEKRVTRSAQPPANSSRNISSSLLFVIAGLDPAIHGELHVSMDHRVKPGGDAEYGDDC
jgi:hypothetical protein